MGAADEQRAIRRITLVGTAINLALAGVKLAAGLLAGSVALVADGIHSLSDLLTDVAVLVGSRMGSRPADEDHPYGHGKYETFSAIAVSFALLAVGAGIAWEAGVSLYDHEESFPGPVVVAVALVSILGKEWLFHATRKVARQTRSPAVEANAWHHRSDAFSSVAVLIGGAAGIVGFGHADQITGILVGVMVVFVGVQLAWRAVGELAEHAIEEQELARIREVLDADPDAKGWHRLRTRLVGREAFVDVHVQIDATLNVREGHTIAHRLEEGVAGALPRAANVTVHVDPWEGEGPGA